MILLLGCQTLTTAVRQTFAHENFCPEERVSVRERPDVKPHALSYLSELPPPDAVAKDPERLKLWQKQNDLHAAQLDKNHIVYEATGCDLDVLYVCSTKMIGKGDNFGNCERQFLPGDISESTPASPPPPAPLAPSDPSGPSGQ